MGAVRRGKAQCAAITSAQGTPEISWRIFVQRVCFSTGLFCSAQLLYHCKPAFFETFLKHAKRAPPHCSAQREKEVQK